MKIAVIDNDGDISLLIANEDEFLPKLRGWYLETVMGYMSTGFDAAHAPDPETATEEQIVEWWEEDEDNGLLIFDDAGHQQPLAAFPGKLAEFRTLKAELLEEDGYEDEDEDTENAV